MFRHPDRWPACACLADGPGESPTADRGSADRRARGGLTLIELLLALVIMVMIAGAVGALAVTFDRGTTYSGGRMEATQHGRVVVGRIERAICTAHGSATFPGFAVFAQTVDRWTFPDTLVVWHPRGEPADPEGLPLWREVVIFCPDPKDPTRLIELTLPRNGRSVPPLDQPDNWRRSLRWLKQSPWAERVELTDLLHTARPTSSRPELAAVRFHSRIRPSMQDWQDYQDGLVSWEELPWVQNLAGKQTGLRQAWCAFELQLVPGSEARGSGNSPQVPVPIFGSAALYYQLHR